MNCKHILLLLVFPISIIGCNSDSESKAASKNKRTQRIAATTKAKVTFVELGSVNCIPCKAMQPVMKDLEEEFGEQIEIVFYDVWKDNTPARQYGIRVIPTQVFLDESGQEFHRHEGFYPKEEIEKLLLARNLTKRAAAAGKGAAR